MQSLFDFFTENKSEIVAGAVAGGVMFGAIRYYQSTQQTVENFSDDDQKEIEIF